MIAPRNSLFRRLYVAGRPRGNVDCVYRRNFFKSGLTLIGNLNSGNFGIFARGELPLGDFVSCISLS